MKFTHGFFAKIFSNFKDFPGEWLVFEDLGGKKKGGGGGGERQRGEVEFQDFQKYGPNSRIFQEWGPNLRSIPGIPGVCRNPALVLYFLFKV